MRNTISPSDICVVILTYNEEANISRTVSRLNWADHIVVLDSGSTDSTAEIVSRHPRAHLHVRPFDSHANQWNHALAFVPDDYPWVLALDADYQLTEEFIKAITDGTLADDVDAYSVKVAIDIDGRVLRCGVYPSIPVLFKRDRGQYLQDGHTQRLDVYGLRVKELDKSIVHEDRKPFERWFINQVAYALREAEALERRGTMRRLVRSVPVVASVAMFAYIYFLRLGVLDGRAGFKYASRAAFAEYAISLAGSEMQRPSRIDP